MNTKLFVKGGTLDKRRTVTISLIMRAGGFLLLLSMAFWGDDVSEKFAVCFFFFNMFFIMLGSVLEPLKCCCPHCRAGKSPLNDGGWEYGKLMLRSYFKYENLFVCPECGKTVEIE